MSGARGWYSMGDRSILPSDCHIVHHAADALWFQPFKRIGQRAPASLREGA